MSGELQLELQAGQEAAGAGLVTMLENESRVTERPVQRMQYT